MNYEFVAEAFLVHMTGIISYPRYMVNFPELPKDASLSLFSTAQFGSHFYSDCLKISKYFALEDFRL